MKKLMKDVHQFMYTAKQTIETLPKLPSTHRNEKVIYRLVGNSLLAMASSMKESPGVGPLRLRLMTEELGEIAISMADEDLAGVADGLVDLIYMIVGTALSFGIDLTPLWDDVQRANMDKFPGGVAYKDGHGKVTKPPGWQGPNPNALLKRQKPLEFHHD